MAIETTIKDQKVHIGDTIRVSQKIQEEGKTRTQAFEGVVISIKGSGTGKSFTVRKIAAGSIGVERIWPVASPGISAINIVKKGKVRRSKLYYLRAKTGKKATKIKSKDEIRKKETKKSSREQKKPGSKG